LEVHSGCKGEGSEVEGKGDESEESEGWTEGGGREKAEMRLST
jgi:hypothetical protein